MPVLVTNSALECRARQAGLADDGLEGADANFGVIRHDDGSGTRRVGSLQHDVAATPPHFGETVD